MVKKWGGDVKAQNRRRRERFKTFINDYKEDKCCEKCGYNKNTKILHFHHLNPKDKTIEINKITTSIKRFNEEIKKCILLCPNCHMEIHT